MFSLCSTTFGGEDGHALRGAFHSICTYAEGRDSVPSETGRYHTSKHPGGVHELCSSELFHRFMSHSMCLRQLGKPVIAHNLDRRGFMSSSC